MTQSNRSIVIARYTFAVDHRIQNREQTTDFINNPLYTCANQIESGL